MSASSTSMEERIAVASIGGATRVLREGAGPPVLLLHGSPDTATEWRGVMRELGGHACCYAPDLPGLGRCDEPPSAFDYSRPAIHRFLDETVEGLGIQGKVVVVVHDIGGVFGVPWAAANLARVAGVVITNTVVFERFPWFGAAKAWASEGTIGRARAEAGMWALGLANGALFRRVFGRISPELPAEDLGRMTREFALDTKSKRCTLRLSRRMVPWEFFDGVDAMVRELIAKVPVRVLWGTRDPYIPARYADSFPGAATTVLQGAGHWVPITRPVEVASAVKAVLAGARG